MSIQNSDFNAAMPAVERRHPVVLRFKSMFPDALTRYEMHAARRGGDLSHVDPIKTASNRLLIGDADWRRQLEEAISFASVQNLGAEIAALRRRKRQKETEIRALEGATPPWKASKEGPLREVILTAHRDWFAERTDMDVILGQTREQVFEQRAVEWLASTFGKAVVHARADHDEMTYHIHAIIAPWVEKTSSRRGTQRVLQPSSIPVLADYEKAQDSVGAFFEQIGLERGKRTKAARREAVETRKRRVERREALRASGKPVPSDLDPTADPALPIAREHVPTPVWWAEETRRLKAKEEEVRKEAARAAHARAQAVEREAEAAKRTQEAQEAIALIDIITSGGKPPETLPTGGIGSRLVAALLRFGQKVKADAEAQAEKRVVEQVAAVLSLRASVAALKDRMVAALPLHLRARFARDTDADFKAADAAAEHLDQLRQKRPEERK